MFIEAHETFVVIGAAINSRRPLSHPGHQIFACQSSWTLRGNSGSLPENLPVDFSRVEIDRVKAPPGRLDRRITLGIEEFVVAVVAYSYRKARRVPLHAGLDASFT